MKAGASETQRLARLVRWLIIAAIAVAVLTVLVLLLAQSGGGGSH